jgi:hypothetical protein
MANPETLEALFKVLSGKMYPFAPNLVRNDTQAAEKVVEYIELIWEEADKAWQVKWNNRSNLQNQMINSFDELYPLRNLSVDTIRKYTASLWRAGRFDHALKFEYIDEVSIERE